MLGIRQIAVLVNKMDLVDYSEKVFLDIEKEYRKFLKQIDLEPKFFVPIAAMKGDNIAARSKAMPWFKGSDVLQILDSFETAKSADQAPFRMPVQAIYKFTESGDDRRIVAGRVESGTLSAGDEVVFLPSNKRNTVKTIEIFNAPTPKTATAGYSVGFTLKEQIYINRGEVMCRLTDALPQVSSLIRVQLFWMSKHAMVKNKEYKLKIGTASVRVSIREIKKVIDASNLGKLDKDKIDRHDVADLVLECTSPVAFDLTGEVAATSRFVLVDGYDIAGGGIISALVKDEQDQVRQQVRAREMNWDFSIVNRAERQQAYGHGAKLVLLTGKVGLNKKDIAKELEKTLVQMGVKSYFLGLGNLLRGLDSDLAENKKTRRESVRRMGEVAHLMLDAGIIVVATASDLNDEELRLLQEVVSRDMIFVVNVGKSEFRDGLVDLNLNPKESSLANARQCLSLLTKANVLSEEL
jgi:bifunctional enzyme CysN/CysC